MSMINGNAGATHLVPGRAPSAFGELPAQVSRLGTALQELADSLDQRLLETEHLGRITTQVNQGLLLDEILDMVFESFQGVIPYDRIGFSLIVDEGAAVIARWARSNLGGMKLGAGFRAPLEGSSLQAVLATDRPRIIDDLQEYLAAKPGSRVNPADRRRGFALIAHLPADRQRRARWVHVLLERSASPIQFRSCCGVPEYCGPAVGDRREGEDGFRAGRAETRDGTPE